MDLATVARRTVGFAGADLENLVNEAALHAAREDKERVTMDDFEQAPEGERHNLKRQYLESRIGVMLGGRVAEPVIFGELTTGAESDLKEATKLARKMVCNWGTSERLGPVAYLRGEEHVFLGREMAQQPDFSEHSARLIDEEVRALIGRLEDQDRQLLERHRPKLDALANALLEHESLAGTQIEALLAGASEANARMTA